jgi:hypothetical protein
MKFWKKPRPASLELLSAQEDDTDRGDEKKHADDLEWEVVVQEKGESDAGDIVE